MQLSISTNLPSRENRRFSDAALQSSLWVGQWTDWQLELQYAATRHEPQRLHGATAPQNMQVSMFRKICSKPVT